MKTVQTILQQLTDPKTILQELRETLRIIDPKFFETEVKYLAAASNLEKELGGSITPSVSEFLAAKEQEFTAEIIYIGWQGFQLNIDIFNAPINALMLRGDYEELHRERRLGTLPMARKSRETINAFYEVMREKYRDTVWNWTAFPDESLSSCIRSPLLRCRDLKRRSFPTASLMRLSVMFLSVSSKSPISSMTSTIS